MNKKTFSEFGIDFSIYHRTSEKIHHETAQDFFSTLERNNVFIKKTTKQFYDEENKLFLADRYISGQCPKCGHEHAYGDQCEKCGSTLSPEELINPTSTLSGSTPVKKETSHWYLPLENHEEWLKNWILKENGSRWKSNVVGQCKSWIESGLKTGAEVNENIEAQLKKHVANEIGPIAKPDEFKFTDSLPKTRSGKIMRRILRALASGDEISGDTSTLEDRSVLDKLRS